MNSNELSIISNRMQTIIDMYNRNNTIQSISILTGLSKSQVRQITSANNFYHGIYRTEGTPEHPINAIIDYNKFGFLLKYNNIDLIRTM